MWFFIMMFICNILIPFVILIGGYFMLKKPPKKINGIVGYRTAMSCKNKDTWTFAHETCGRLWIKLGWILLLPSIIVQIPFRHASDQAIGMMTMIVEGVQICFLLGSIVLVEKALHDTFDKKGERK